MDRTPQLHLLRHAKSSWDDASLRDDQRPLTGRGRRAAGLLRQHFDAVGLRVDLVLCSPARRTRETWARVRAGLHSDPEVKFVPEVYAATAGELLGLIRGVDRSVTSVMIVGHNPGIEELTAGLAGGGETLPTARLRDGFPTGGFATLTVGSTWADLDWGGARLSDFIRPRDLTSG